MPPRKNAGSARAYLFWGQEEIRKQEALRDLLDSLVPPEDRDLDVQYIDATNAGVTGESILHAVRDRAMFSERRVVVVLNAGRLRPPRHVRTQEVLARGIPDLPDYSRLVLVAYAEDADERAGRAPFGEKLMSALKSHGEVRQFALLKPEELARLAEQEAAAAGKKLPSNAAALLVGRAGPDSRPVLQEVRKLVSFVGERDTITPADVQEMVAPPPDDNVFHLLDATMAGNRAQAISVLRQLRESGSAVPQLLSLLGRTLRQTAQAKYLAERGVSPAAEPVDVRPEILELLPDEGSLYRGTKEWQRKRLWGQARQFSWEGLHHALDRLAVLDAGTKGWEHGIEDPDLALELFVSSLCDAAGAPPSRPVRR